MQVEKCVKKLKSKGIIDFREIYICIIKKYNRWNVWKHKRISFVMHI